MTEAKARRSIGHYREDWRYGGTAGVLGTTARPDGGVGGVGVVGGKGGNGLAGGNGGGGGGMRVAERSSRVAAP